jgi:DNA invertase Pin-like site-specific DNA recombinase
MKKAHSTRRSDPSKAIAYLRVSTDEQRLGPEAQRAAIENWARREGVDVVGWYTDQGVSGGSDIENRTGLAAALGQLRAEGAGSLVVAKRDRLARDVYVAATIERAAAGAGAKVVCADGVGNGETPADAFMRTILDGAAAYERALIRARTKAALAVKKARGQNVGTPPYGYRLGEDGKTLVPDEQEQQTLAVVRSMRAAGASYRAIHQEATSRALFGRTGRPFTLQAVFTMASRATPPAP